MRNTRSREGPVRALTARRQEGKNGSAGAGHGTARPCVVVVPVYNSFPEAVECIRSVLAHTRGAYRLLVIDDASSDGRLADFLPPEVLADSRLQVSRNRRNLGFVRTCNVAMRRTDTDDVVLLNSDTVVTPGWLGRLHRAAASSQRAGMVSPLTNNGEICSVPIFVKNNDVPRGYSIESFAALVESVSARRYPELPTCVGFCVYLKRAMLDRIGLFDARRFGKGYGEENDLSWRAREAGYVTLLDDATFVFHRGAASFGTQSRRLQEKHLGILEKKQPGYIRAMHEFIAENPLADVQARIRDEMLQRWNDGARCRVLHILHKSPMTADPHALPGGVEYHVADLAGSVPGAHWSLYPAGDAYHLKAHVPGAERVERLPATESSLVGLVRRAYFDVIHLHQAGEFPYDTLVETLRRHGRYTVSLHDYAMVCPNTNLVTQRGQLCDGRQCVEACGQKRASVKRLRSTTTELLRDASAALHFSDSTRADFVRILGNHVPWRLLRHGVCVPPDHVATERRKSPPKPSRHVPLKVAFLGAISRVKGAELIRKIVTRQTLPSGQPVEWHLIGVLPGELAPHVVQHGRYARTDLPAILAKVDPHLVAILSICPETYCFTLDESLLCGVPVVCTPVGAPAERVAQQQCGWVLKKLQAGHFFKTLDRLVASWDEYLAVRQRIGQTAVRSIDEATREYDALYREIAPRPAVGPTAKLLRVVARLQRPFSAQRPPASLAHDAARDEVQKRRLAYRRTIDRIRDLAQANIPRDATVLVLSKGDPELLELDGRHAWHFPQDAHGAYSGFHPAGSTSAIAHLEWMRAAGATHLLVPDTSLWWLRHYRGFRKHLQSHYRTLVRRKSTGAMFSLCDSKAPGTSAGIARVSIVVSACGANALAAACLKSLMETLPSPRRMELILVDDAPAGAGRRSHLARLAEQGDWRLSPLHVPRRLDFSAVANRAAAVATGEFLLFFGTNAILLPGWLPLLLRAFREQPDAGAVGGKLVFPDGRLRGAGGIVYRDGTLAEFGHNDYHVDAKAYQNLRRADFCSAALLLTPRRLFQEIGGFDPGYRCDAYRDADYGFQLRQRAWNVYCAADCVAVTPENGVPRSVAQDRAAFVARWRQSIARQPRRGSP